MPPAPRIAFSLSAADVAAGVRSRSDAAAVSDALEEIRTTPLLQPLAQKPRCTIAQPATSFAPLRFVPAPTPTPTPTPTPSLPRATPGAPALTFATMIGRRPRSVLCSLPDCDDPFHKHRTSPLPLLPAAPEHALRPQPGPSTGMLPSRGCEELQSQSGTPVDGCADQYSVRPLSTKTGCPRIIEVMHGVLFSNVLDPNCPAQDTRPGIGSKHVSPLLGDTGHIERASAWSHIAGAGIFLVYAIVRTVVADSTSPAGVSATVAAFGVVVTMLSSAIYHSTAPDMDISLLGRFLDYSSIYVGLVTTAVADIAAATNSFLNVPEIAVADIPAAGGVIFLFFMWRRTRIPARVTWARDASLGVEAAGEPCSMGSGLFKNLLR